MKLVFITGPSCAGKSTRFSHLWDSLSIDNIYEDIEMDYFDPKHERNKHFQIARTFKDLNITLIGRPTRKKDGWVSIDQMKNYHMTT